MTGPGGPIHPEADILDDLLGEADPAVSDRLHAHLGTCADCRALRDAWRRTLEETKGAARGGRPVAHAPRRPGAFARRLPSQRLLAALAAPGGDAEGRGRVTARPGGRNVRVYVERVHPPAPGRLLVMWCLEDGVEVRPLGFVPVAANGRGRVDLVLPVGTGVGHGLVLTEEPTPLPPRPTGTPRLTGTLTEV